MPFLGKIAESRNNARNAENSNLTQQEQIKLGIEQAALENAKFNRQAPDVRMSQSLRGEGIANVQPVSFSGGGRDLRISGGLSPALIGQNSRDIGNSVSRQALMSQLNSEQGGPRGSQFTDQAAGPAMPANRGSLGKIIDQARQAQAVPIQPPVIPFNDPYTNQMRFQAPAARKKSSWLDHLLAGLGQAGSDIAAGGGGA